MPDDFLDRRHAACIKQGHLPQPKNDDLRRGADPSQRIEQFIRDAKEDRPIDTEHLDTRRKRIALVDVLPFFGWRRSITAVVRNLHRAAHAHHEKQRSQRHAYADRHGEIDQNSEAEGQQQQAPVAIGHPQQLDEAMMFAHAPGDHEQDGGECCQRHERHEI